jgi:hypothetical protein
MRDLLSTVLLVGTLSLVPATGAYAQRTLTTAGEAPGGLTATAADARTVDLSWNPAREAAGYRVLRATSLDGPFQEVTPRPITATTFRDENLTPRTTYAYQVQAVYLRWGPATSAAVSVTTPADLALPAGIREVTTVERTQLQVHEPTPSHAAPAGLSVEATGPTSARLSWATAVGATAYRVSRAASASGPWTVLTEAPTSTTSYTDNGLAPQLTVFYRVEAWYRDEQIQTVHLTEPVVIRDQTGEIIGTTDYIRPPGQYVAAEPVSATTPSAPIVFFSARETQPGTIRFSWDPVPSAVRYVISGPAVQDGSTAVTGQDHTLPNVPPGTHQYTLAVRYQVAGIGTVTTQPHGPPSARVTVYCRAYCVNGVCTSY